MSYIGPNHQMYDIRQYQYIRDLCGPKKDTLSAIPDNSLSGVLKSTPDFSKFAQIVEKSGLSGILSSYQANATLFVPSDKYLECYDQVFFDQMDRGTALKIVMYSMMNRVIDKKLLQSSPTSSYPTKDRSHNLFVSNKFDTLLNGRVRVIHWNYKVDNGMIHVVDGLLFYEDIPSVP